MKKLCYVATIPAVAHAFLRPHIRAAAAAGFDVTVVCSADDGHLLDGLEARVLTLAVQRKPSPWQDLCALLRLWRICRRERFDIVHSIMPKTGLLAMVAAGVAGVAVRLHTFTGQVWVTRRGLTRGVLKAMDRLIATLATHALVDSPSQLDFLVQEGVLTVGKAGVLGVGSVSGVDLHRFRPDAAIRAKIRAALVIPEGAPTIVFVGRINRDKGMPELAAALRALAIRHPDLHLLLVGSEEDVSFQRMQAEAGEAAPRLRHVPFTPTPEHYLAAADLFCLPSHREGFGSTIIEAAACGVPCVATRIYGITDAVDDGTTGILVPVGDIPELTAALSRMIGDDGLRHRMGLAARTRAQAAFPTALITGELIRMYERLTS